MHNVIDTSEIAEVLAAEDFCVHTITENSITIKTTIADKNVYIEGRLSNRFPLELPSFYLHDRMSFGRLAHVAWLPEGQEDIGLICGGVTISLNINYESPPQVFLYGLQFAIKTISRPLSNNGINIAETKLEFSGHWRFAKLHREKSDIALLEPSGSVVPIKISKKRHLRFYFASKSQLNENYSLYPYLNKSSFSPSHWGLYVPLPNTLLPPAPHQDILQWWHDDVLPVLSTDVRADINSFQRTVLRKSKIISIVSSIDFDQSTTVWIGIDFVTSKKGTPPLSMKIVNSGWVCQPFSPQIHSKQYLLPRGGASNVLSSSAILLVGCGSVGGEVARLLAHSGIGRINLVDFDQYETSNIYRHILNPKYIGMKKTEALKDELQSRFPYLVIEVIKDCNRLCELVEDNIDLKSYDGIIVATGDPTEERYFNQALYGFSSRPWVIYTWLEGYGVGGHSIYVHKDMHGCLSCLFRDPTNGEPSLHNIQNFMEVEQPFAVDISGCGTHFLPFSHVDAIQTAVLATRMATNALQNRIKESVRTSWKGDDNEAKCNNLKLTRRYYNYHNNMNYETLFWSGCLVCSK